MRSLLLATIARRQGISFQLKNAAYQVIGTMMLNPATARHEMELSEEDFLKHSKELARICAIPGMAWYVVEFRDAKVTKIKKDDPQDDLKGVPFFTLRKMAKDLGIDVKGLKNEGLKKAIRYGRHFKSLEVQNAGQLAA